MFTINEVKDLAWCDAEKTFFSCSVKYAEFSDFLPVGVNATDATAHIRELWENGLAGVYGPIQEYVEPVVAPAPTPSSGAVQVTVLTTPVPLPPSAVL